MAFPLNQDQTAIREAAGAPDAQHPDAGFQVANDAMQLRSGYGYLRDYPLERIVRELFRP